MFGESCVKHVGLEDNCPIRVPPGLKERLSGATRRLATSPFVRNAGWIFGGQIASLGVQAAYFVDLARLLVSSEYGILAGAAALVSIFSQYSAMDSGRLVL